MTFTKMVIRWEKYFTVSNSEEILSRNGMLKQELYEMNRTRNGRMGRRALSMMSRCFCDMVERLMDPIPAPFTQLNINIIPPGDKPRAGNAAEGILDLFLPYDPWPFFDLDELGRMEMLAGITLRALDLLQDLTGLDCAPAREAVALARGTGFRNVWVPLRKRSKAGLTAEIEVEHDTRGVTVWMTVLNRRGQMLKRVPVLHHPPDSWGLKRDYLGELSWEEGVAILSSSVSGFFFSLNPLTGEARLRRTDFEREKGEGGDLSADLSTVPPQARFLARSETVPGTAHTPAVDPTFVRESYAFRYAEGSPAEVY